ncbi:MAG: TetR family transcriptional regulator [Peptococcaceae bacterium BRH_c4b]|nr:MAG: TetR family transcriptional regulator [Peptococcaceae bacterium BRH_c4b]
MFSKFLSLEPEKQERILNAALKEFAQKGYKNASTNEIVKEANISKGLLFHYFNNKKELFLFLYDYSLDIFMNEFFGKIDMNVKDILKRWPQIALVKIEVIRKYPEIFNFIVAANTENASEIKNDLELRNKEIITSSYAKVLEDIDISKFREGIDIKRAINIIIWTAEGLANQEKAKAKLSSLGQINYEKVLAEFDIYIELLRNCFYK